MQLSLLDPIEDLIAEDLLQQCKAAGIDPKDLLFQMQLRNLWEGYLSKLPQQKQLEFAVRLIDLIES